MGQNIFYKNKIFQNDILKLRYLERQPTCL